MSAIMSPMLRSVQGGYHGAIASCPSRPADEAKSWAERAPSHNLRFAVAPRCLAASLVRLAENGRPPCRNSEMVKSHNKQMARDLFRQVRDLVLEPRIKAYQGPDNLRRRRMLVERSWPKKPAIDSAADSALPIHGNHGICRCFLTHCVVGRRLSFEQCSVRSRFSMR